jgi:hypothetical protein
MKSIVREREPRVDGDGSGSTWLRCARAQLPQRRRRRATAVGAIRVAVPRPATRRGGELDATTYKKRAACRCRRQRLHVAAMCESTTTTTEAATSDRSRSDAEYAQSETRHPKRGRARRDETYCERERAACRWGRQRLHVAAMCESTTTTTEAATSDRSRSDAE